MPIAEEGDLKITLQHKNVEGGTGKRAPLKKQSLMDGTLMYTFTEKTSVTKSHCCNFKANWKIAEDSHACKLHTYLV